ncbi:hypothetical protein AA13755_2258 [Acetobacter peroxydans NBRC 13755]|nr:hypothetical protein AA13755_2258 [Acetobacter peroxydans NBRC 13755]
MLVCNPGQPERERALAILDDLSGRRETAAEKIGTYHPARLRRAVATLAPHHMLKRQGAASGLRILPVAAWREQNSEALSALLTNRSRTP